MLDIIKISLVLSPSLFINLKLQSAPNAVICAAMALAFGLRILNSSRTIAISAAIFAFKRLARVRTRWSAKVVQKQAREPSFFALTKLSVVESNQAAGASTSKRAADEDEEPPTPKKRRFAESEKTAAEQLVTQPNFDGKWRFVSDFILFAV